MTQLIAQGSSEPRACLIIKKSPGAFWGLFSNEEILLRRRGEVAVVAVC